MWMLNQKYNLTLLSRFTISPHVDEMYEFLFSNLNFVDDERRWIPPNRDYRQKLIFIAFNKLDKLLHIVCSFVVSVQHYR